MRIFINFIIFVNVKLKFIIFEGKRPLVEIDQWPEQTYYTWIFIKLTHFFIKSLGELQELYVWLTALVLLFSSCHCFFLGFTDSLFSSLVVVVVVVEAGSGTGRVGQEGTEDDRSRRGGVGQRGWSLWGGTGTGTEGGELCVHFTKGGRWHYICKRGEGDLQIVLLARFGALWCQEREH